jgi:hypothetical protein
MGQYQSKADSKEPREPKDQGKEERAGEEEGVHEWQMVCPIQHGPFLGSTHSKIEHDSHLTSTSTPTKPKCSISGSKIVEDDESRVERSYLRGIIPPYGSTYEQMCDHQERTRQEMGALRRGREGREVGNGEKVGLGKERKEGTGGMERGYDEDKCPNLAYYEKCVKEAKKQRACKAADNGHMMGQSSGDVGRKDGAVLRCKSAKQRDERKEREILVLKLRPKAYVRDEDEEEGLE